MAESKPTPSLGSAASGLSAWSRRIEKHRGLIVPITFVSLLIVILVPLPPLAMDLLIAMNISIAVITLLTTIYMKRALDFSVFPSLLLAATLFRLVINIASTRLILNADASSPEEARGVAGEVISAFGTFVAGESLAVGVIIFLIIVIVQFVVITKGATRISEVAARFTLDAMPGKQMAIDADLNAGILSEQEAKERRDEIRREADFFGAMDGASKFVRGDAIAGILITIINILGGFAIGMFQKGWPAGQTAEVFTMLTIGDGLTSQIPSFVIAIAAALVVTRSGDKADLGTELTNQIISQPRGLAITSGFLGMLALTPLPTLPLLAMASLFGGIAFTIRKRARQSQAVTREAESAPTKPEPPAPETLLKLDILELEVGYGLVALVDTNQGGDLLDRISAVRRQLAAELGFIMPPVRIRDNMQLQHDLYKIKVKGSVIAQGQVMPGRLLAMDSGIASGPIDGFPTKEPAFGLDAYWIDENLHQRAEGMNYTVVEPSAVIATHITEIVKKHAEELLSREEVNNLVQQLKERAPKLVEEVIPSVVKPGELQKVLQNLLRERVPIRDLETIIETLGDWAPRTKDLDVLTEYVRNGLKRTICQAVATPRDDGTLRVACITIDPRLEDQIQAYIDRTGGATAVTMPPDVSARISGWIIQALRPLTAAGHTPVVLASPPVRAVVHQLLEPRVPSVMVLGYNEVTSDVEVEALGLASPELQPINNPSQRDQHNPAQPSASQSAAVNTRTQAPAGAA